MQRSNRLQWLARAGYAARGAVFVILGYFTAIAAISAHVLPIDSKGALRSLLTQPAGAVLLLALAAGLLCFALWRQAQRCAFGAYGIAEAVFRRIDGKSIAKGQPSWLRA